MKVCLRGSYARMRTYRVTIRNARYYHIHRRRVSPAEVYSSISENFRIVYTNETEQSSLEMISAYGGVEVGEIVTLPEPETWKVGRLSSETTQAP